MAVLIVSLPEALPCSIPARILWTKDPRSSSPLFRVVIEGKVGYINAAGRLVIEPRFLPAFFSDGAGDFIEQLAFVLTSHGLVFIDETGTERNFGDLVIREPFSESLTEAKRPRKEGAPAANLLINSSGHTIAALEGISLAGRFSEGLAAFWENNGGVLGTTEPFGHRRGYVDRRGRITIPAQFAYTGPFSEGLAAVGLDGNCWVSGGIGGRLPAPSALSMHTSCGPLPAPSVAKRCAHGYIDTTGRIAIPARYEYAKDFVAGRAAVGRQGKWALIDASGNEVTPFHFDEVQPISEGRAAVRRGSKWGYIDRNGLEALPYLYDEALPFSNGVAPVLRSGHFVFIDGSGAQELPGSYLKAGPFVQGLAPVQLDEDNFAWINRKGAIVFRYTIKPAH